MHRTCSIVPLLSLFLVGCSLSLPEAEHTDQPLTAPSPVAIEPAPPAEGHLQPISTTNITRVWANEGGDKVARDELRSSLDPNAVLNTVWDGVEISLFGARNEVIGFNLVLEAPSSQADQVNVIFNELIGPDGHSISSREASGEELLNFTDRNIELFYVRYLEIRGLSTDLAYDVYDERHIPERCRRPSNSEGDPSGGWEDRPCHNKLYPDIAAPIEFHSRFTIPRGTNQSIWGDIYIPKSSPPGFYTGQITISEAGTTTWQLPVSLQVRDFELPDLPNARTMLFFNSSDVNDRYLGTDFTYPDPGSDVYFQSLEIGDHHFQLAHRHKISLINEDNDYVEVERMDDAWIDRLSGDLFTTDHGYDGIGVGVGNNVYSIGTYSSWPWVEGTREDMWINSDAWVTWFEAQDFDTPTDYFLYLIDESDDHEQIERWAQWMDENPGPGQRLNSMATIDLPSASANIPSLDIATSALWVGITDAWQTAVNDFTADPSKHFYFYNGSRPASGSFAIEDDGIALRTLGWIQFKKGIERWFYWESTYYLNFQCLGSSDEAQTNVYQQAMTYGCFDDDDEILGEAGWNYFNGDGVLFYPGTDLRFPDENYGFGGPIASLRLKLWRRGIQDLDYLEMAMAIDPQRTAQIVDRIIPLVLWEYGVDELNDPTYVLTDISWPTDPDTWEAARAELADIIEGSSG
jgi:hypothetical protein